MYTFAPSSHTLVKIHVKNTCLFQIYHIQVKIHLKFTCTSKLPKTWCITSLSQYYVHPHSLTIKFGTSTFRMTLWSSLQRILVGRRKLTGAQQLVAGTCPCDVNCCTCCIKRVWLQQPVLKPEKQKWLNYTLVCVDFNN